jgi:hypothetical protein
VGGRGRGGEEDRRERGEEAEKEIPDLGNGGSGQLRDIKIIAITYRIPFICIHTLIHTHTHTHICIHICIHICKHIYIYIS